MVLGRVTLKIALSHKRAREYAEDEREPSEGDYVKAPSGLLGSKTYVGIVGGHGLGEFDDDDEADAAIRSKMRREKFYPSVWNESDHGNLSVDTSFRS